MKILYVACGGFGDVSWTTSWPRLWAEDNHEIDVYLMYYTGNPFYANPYIRNIFITKCTEAYKDIKDIIKQHSYDIVLIPNSTTAGVKEVIEVTKNLKNVHLFKGATVSQIISGLKIPRLIKPELFFTGKELNYIEKLNLQNSVLIHPLSSGVNETSRNIDFDLIIECSKKINNIVVVYGGRKYLPLDDLKKMETAGIKLLWEDYNCFNDEYGNVIGKFFALVSKCKLSIHAWSGSFIMPMAYNKPYIMIVPGYGIRANSGSPYIDTKILYDQGIHRANNYSCLNPSAWCVTNKTEVITEAIDKVSSGKTCTFFEDWTII